MNKLKWHTSLFDELNEYWEEIADARFTQNEIKFIEKVVKTKDSVLDLCCGTGRHSILLHKKGWNITGLDISPNLLKIAKNRMKDKQVQFPLVRGEMRHLPFQSGVFAAVINMFTSFGYLPSKKEDMKSLNEIARILKQNGLLLIDILNRERLVSTFRKKDWGEFPSFYMLEKRTLDVKESKLYSQWVIVDRNSGKTKTFDHKLRLYPLPQLQEMLQNAGLTIEKVYGDYEEQQLQQNSLRLIVLSRKAHLY